MRKKFFRNLFFRSTCCKMGEPMSFYKHSCVALLGATLLAQPLWAAPPPGPGREQVDSEFGPPVTIQGMTTVRVCCRGQVFPLKVRATSLSEEYMVVADAPELQKIARAFGARMEWNGATLTLTCHRDRDVRSMKEGQDRVTRHLAPDGSREAELPFPAQVVEGAVNIPLSALEEFLDVRVTVRPNNMVFIEPLIRDVRFDNTGGKTRLVIDSTAPVNYKSFKLRSPDRYVIDISGAVLDTPSLTVPHPDLGNVRLGQFELGPAISRIVVPVRSGIDVNAPQGGQGQSLSFAVRIPNPTTTAGIPAPVPPLNGQEEGQHARISSVQWVRTAQGWKLILNSNGPLHYNWRRLPGNHLVMDIPNAVLLEPKQDFPGNGGTVTSVHLSQCKPMPTPAVRVTMDLSKKPHVTIGRGESEEQLVLAIDDKEIDPYPANCGRGSTRVIAIRHVPMPAAPIRYRPSAKAPDESQFTKISSVQWLTAAPGGGKLVINANAPLRYDWQRLPDNRMVVDIPNALLADPRQEFPGNGDTISGIRLSQNQPPPNPVVRVVMDLNKPLEVAMGKGDSEDQLILEVANHEVGPYPGTRGIGSTRSTQGVTGGLIVIDPGHGGSDVGAQNKALGLNEATVTLDICRRLTALLKAQGWTVLLTRTSDIDVSYWGSSATEELSARVKVANERKADLFISVHCNASVNPNSSGTSLHYYKQSDRALASELKSNFMAATGRPDRGLQANRFYVLTHTQMPAVLVETAFISNAQEGSLLADPNFRQRIAEGLAQGVRQYAARNLNFTAAKP